MILSIEIRDKFQWDDIYFYLFIQIAYYTHMGQAITIQKYANV